MNNQNSSNQMSCQSNFNRINISMNMNNQSLSQSNIILLEKQNKDYKIKINNLENYIKELQIKLEEKEKIINKEKIKNDNLNKKIKELENISNNNSIIKDIKELENEIKLFKSYCKFSEEEKLISIKFISVEQNIDYSLISKKTEKFIKIEASLYEKYPKLEIDNYFNAYGKRINRNKTLEQNNINNNDIISLNINNLD